jgi:alpha-galactosidase/6-phospho-beta-glucosidase family protein
MTDILAVDGLDQGVFALVDVDATRLDLARQIGELVVQPLMERDRQKAKYALMLDPLTAAVCSLEEIDRLFDEMWEAERESLTAFS